MISFWAMQIVHTGNIGQRYCRINILSIIIRANFEKRVILENGYDSTFVILLEKCL